MVLTLKVGLRNYKLPKDKQETAADITVEEAKAIIEELKANPPKKKRLRAKRSVREYKHFLKNFKR